MDPNIAPLRKAIKEKHPNLKFKIRTVSFSGFGYGSKLFVESDAWGMTKGNRELYKSVETIAKKYGAIASW